MNTWQELGQRVGEMFAPYGSLTNPLQPETVDWTSPEVVDQMTRLKHIATMYDQFTWGDGEYLDRMVRRIIISGQENPEILQLADRSFTAAAAVGVMDFWQRAYLKNLDDPIGVGARMIDAAYDLINQEEERFISPGRWTQTTAQANRWNEWLSKGSAVDSIGPMLDRMTSDERVALAQRLHVPADQSLKQFALNRLGFIPDVPAAQSQIVASGRYVAFNWPTEQGAEQWVRVEVPEGFAVDTPAQAMEALVRAGLGDEGFDIEETEGLAGAQTGQGQLNEWLGAAVRLVQKPFVNTNGWWTWISRQSREAEDWLFRGDPYEYNPSMESSTTRQGWEAEARARDMVAQMQSPDSIAAAAAFQLYEENLQQGMTAGGALDLANSWLQDLSPEELATLQEGYASDLSRAGVEEALTEAFKRPQGVEAFAGEFFEATVEGLSWWNRFALSNGTRALDALGDAGQGLLDAVGIPGPWNHAEGFDPVEAFRSNWDPTRAEDLSTYWNITDPSLAFLADMSGSILFDPFTYITPGAGQFSRWTHRLLSTPEGVRTALRQRTTLNLASEIVRHAQAGDRAWIAEVVLKDGMRYELAQRLYQAQSVDEVLDVFRSALPGGGGGGTWLLDFSGHWATRNSASQIARLVEAAEGSGPAAQKVRLFLADSLGGYSRDPLVSVAPFQFPSHVTDTLWYLFPDDPAKRALWIDRMDEVIRSATDEQNVLRTVGEAQLQEARTGLTALSKGTPSEIRYLLRDVWGTSRVRPKGASDDLGGLLDSVSKAETRVRTLEQEIQQLPTMGMDPADLARELAKRQQELEVVRGAGWQELKSLDDEARVLRNQYTVDPAKATEAKPLRPPEAEARLREIGSRMAELRKDPMLRGFSTGDAITQRLLDRHAEFITQYSKLRHQAEQAQALVARGGKRDFREAAARFWQELEDTVAVELGLPVKANRTNPLTGGPVYDWSPVTGQEGRYGFVESAPRLYPLAGDDKAIADAVAQTGFFSNQSYFRLPASPMMIAAYRASKKGGAWNSMLASMTRGAESSWGKAVIGGLDGMRRAFLTILLNPRLAFRSAFDQPLRAITTTGHWHSMTRAVGLDDAGQLVMGKRTPGFAQIMNPVPTKTSHWASSERFAADFPSRTQWAMREAQVASPTADFDSGAWTVVVGKRSDGAKQMGWVVDPKLHRISSERWLTGTWMRSEASGPFSQSVLDTATKLRRTPAQIITDETLTLSDWDLTAFRDWWWQRGRIKGQGVKLKPGEAIDLTGFDDSAMAMLNGLRVRAYQADNASLVLDSMVRHAAEAKPYALGTAADETVFRSFGPVPSDAVGATGAKRSPGVLGALAKGQDVVSEVLYGRPSRNQYGLFHMDYQDKALRALSEGNQGRILTPAKLAELAQQGKVPAELGDINAAQRFFTGHLDELDDIAYQNGLVTVSMLENVADRFARNWAAHIMYQPGATSMLGRALQKTASPFGPAQFDWASWWGWEMTRAATVGMFGHYTQIPNVLNFRALGHNLGEILGQGTGYHALGALPLNLRLMARAADLGGMMAREEQYEDQPFTFLNPSKLVEEFTFLPTLNTSQDFLVSLGPSLGPIASWAIRLLPDPDTVEEGSWLWNVGQEVRRAMEAMAPSISWGDSMEFGNWGQMGSGLLTAMFPQYEGSPTDIARLLWDVVGKTSAWDRGAPGAPGKPPMYRDAFDSVLAQKLTEREGLRAMVYDGSDWLDFLREVEGEAERLASSEDFTNSALRFLPGARLLYSAPDLETPLYEGFVSELDTLVGWGAVGQSTVDNLKNLWKAYEDGTATDEQIGELHDSARNTLFGLSDIPDGRLLQDIVLCQHPELALLFVGRYEATKNDDGTFRAPEGWVTGDGRAALPVGDEGLERLQQGLEFGWYAEKPEAQRAKEVEWRLASAQRRVLADAYMAVFRRDTFDAGREIAERDQTIVTLPDALKQRLALAGMVAVTGELPDRMSGADLAARFDATRDALTIPYPRDTESGIPAKLARDEGGRELLSILDELEGVAVEMGYESPAEWPDEWTSIVRQDFASLIDRQVLSEEDYRKEYQSWYGPLDWVLDEPPPIGELPEGTQVLRFQPNDLFVVDGDTVDAVFADGETARFRLVGVNAPDSPMPGADEARADLIELLHNEGFEDVALVFYKPDKFGTEAGTDFSTGRPRWKCWLYVNGVPIYNPDVFSFSNPLGIGTGASYVPLPRPESVEVP